MKFTTVKLKFVSEKTPKEAYEIHLTNINDSICLNAYDHEALQQIRLDLENGLALVRNLQFKLRYAELSKKTYLNSLEGFGV